MKSKKWFAVFYVLAFFVMIINALFYLNDQLFFSLENLPTGEFVYASLSPEGDRSANFYRVDTPKGSAVRVEILTFNDEKGSEKCENVYWETDKSVVTIGWVDNDIITVDEVPMNISKGDTFDSRRKTSLSQKW